jgi:hypothetical protein
LIDLLDDVRSQLDQSIGKAGSFGINRRLCRSRRTDIHPLRAGRRHGAASAAKQCREYHMGSRPPLYRSGQIPPQR